MEDRQLQKCSTKPVISAEGSFKYGPFGRRIYKSSSSGTSVFDNNGNTLTKVAGSNTTSFAWDFENRLTQVTLPGSGGTVSFAYDPFGRRIKKVVSSTSTTSIFAYDGDNLVEETNSSGTAVARYADGLNIDEPLAMLRSSTTSFYHADGLGSITSLSNTSGTIAQTYTFDSFGNQTGSSGSLTNPFRYTARESDTETGLYYYRARYYDQLVGRFVNEDPIRFEGGENFYRYVHNRSIGLSDPMGLTPSDVQRAQAACMRCTQKLTDGGSRQPGTGIWRGFRNDNQVLLGFLRGLRHGDFGGSGPLQGCKSQAGMAKDCLTGDPTLGGWTFSETMWWLGFHTVVVGESPDPNDPLVLCDPWRNETWTAPRDPWPRFAKF